MSAAAFHTRPTVLMPPANRSKPMEAIEAQADDSADNLVEIRATGDVLLDVSFTNTSACTKSIPSDAIQKFRISKSAIPSTRFLYRVRLETLKKCSRYFSHLLGSDNFGEGRAIKEAFRALAQLNLNPTEIKPDQLPKIKIVDEDDATGTLGREAAFRDMLRIVHGADHLTKPISILYFAVLVIMADRYDCLCPITRYFGSAFGSFKYPQTLDKSTEELLRQKIVIYYYTNQAVRLASATKELILRGSSRWGSYDDGQPVSTTLWWNLPDGLEAELAHRRACIVRTIASLQMNFLALYASRGSLQCRLGYDSSAACDSFQLGEMIKFLIKKGLLSLIPFQAVSPEDPEYIWPDAYTGDIENLIGLLRQCPSYQIDKNHSHCGLRSKILPALGYIRDCIDTGIGIKVARWKADRSSQTWIIPKNSNLTGGGRRPFVVGGEVVGEASTRAFDSTKMRMEVELGATAFNVDISAKKLFTAEKWIWTSDMKEEDEDRATRLPRVSPSLKF